MFVWLKSHRVAMMGLLWCLSVPIVSTANAAMEGDSDIPDPTKAASNPLTDAGTSGLFLYRKHCQSCHGYLGAGTDDMAPLLGSQYASDHKNRRAFHRQFTHSAEHAEVARGTRKNPGPGFNQLELIGKFLREIEAWHVLLERTKPKS